MAGLPPGHAAHAPPRLASPRHVAPALHHRASAAVCAATRQGNRRREAIRRHPLRPLLRRHVDREGGRPPAVAHPGAGLPRRLPAREWPVAHRPAALALPAEVAAGFLGVFRGTTLESHCGQISPVPAAGFNIRADNRDWVARRCVSQALAAFEIPILLTGVGAAVAQRLYIPADGWDPSPFRHVAASVEGKPGWRVSKPPCSHDVMVSMPQELAAELLTLA
jgi:hypothetical protein